MDAKIVVVGSANTDMVIRLDHLPAAGETVAGGIFSTAQGGKGANQAVAAARLGARVTFVARLGKDSLGEQSLAAYQAEGIDTRFIWRDDTQPSGTALIMVNQSGENIIAVAGGANEQLSSDNVAAAEGAIRAADILLVQLEIPLAAVQMAIELAARHKVAVILNPAPARSLPAELLGKVAVLTPNQNEARLLAGQTGSDDLPDLARRLLARGPHSVAVTLGERGALISEKGGGQSMVPGLKITPVDTTAAGDAFNGALAVALARGKSLREAASYANTVAALAATRPGAQPSLPTSEEVEKFLSANHPAR